MWRALCMPPQQISPSAASRSPNSSAMSQALRNVSAMRLRVGLRIGRPLGGRAGRVDAHDAIGPDADLLAARLAMRQPLRTCVEELLPGRVIAHRRAAAGRRPDRRDDRADDQAARANFLGQLFELARRSSRC